MAAVTELVEVTGGLEPPPQRSFGWRRMASTVGQWVLSVVLVLLVWQIFLKAFHISPFVGKGPLDVWRYLTNSATGPAARSKLWHNSLTTLRDAGLGLAAGSTAALFFAMVFNLQRTVEHTFMPVAMVLRSVPLVAMTPIIALIFGRGLVGVTVIAGIVTFFPTLVNVTLALRATPRASVDLFTAYGAGSATTLRKLQFPTALPAVFASLRIAAPLALVGALLAEWLATGRGLGYLMLQSQTLGNYNMVWAATAFVTAYSLILYAIISAIEKWVLTRYADPNT
jgi:ABC-type nitrate/sulfonate/bicarbonate transport system permease component